MAQPFLTFAIDNTKQYAVVARTYCWRILIQENYNSATPPTADIQQFNPDGSGPVNIAKGTPAIFSTGPYLPGQTAGFVNTPSGSITVQQIESMKI
jgi:hypothetical protein